jgi:lipopolysaccharide biosynthesis glycosyltransferase
MFTHAFSKKKVVEPDGSTEPVHIAVCFDENMDMPFLALAESLRYSLKNRYRTLIIHAIYSGQLSETVSRLTSHNSNTFIVGANIELQTLPLRDVFTHATYTRLYLHIILPDVHKVIYLDPDTIVVNDISILYDTAERLLPGGKPGSWHGYDA